MAVPAGIDLAVTFATGYATKPTGITLNFTAAELDTTGAGETSDFDTFIGGRRRLAGTYTCRWDSTKNVTGTSFAALGGTSASATFTFSADSTPHTIAGNILITSVDATSQIDQANDVTFGWVMSGAPTITLGVV